MNIRVSEEMLADLRSGQDRRGAIDQQTKPTGDGAVVLDYVNERIALLIVHYSFPTALPGILKPAELKLLRDDLTKRSEMGTKKYGTPLRVNNGRQAAVDLYQEVSDAIMYAGQALMEGDREAGNFFELFVNIGSQLAGLLNKRAGQ